MLVDEKKYPQKIVFNLQNVKKGGENGGTSISPNIGGVPSSGILFYKISQIYFFACKLTVYLIRCVL